MGVYLDGIDHKTWLEAHAWEVALEEWTWERVPADAVPLVDWETTFPCLMVAWNRLEMERAFPRAGDGRARRYLFAELPAVREVLGPRMLSAMRQDVAEGIVRDAVLL